jgi:hypothetical protein
MLLTHVLLEPLRSHAVGQRPPRVQNLRSSHSNPATQ